MVLPNLTPEQVQAEFKEEVTTIEMPSGKGYVRHVTLNNN